MQLGQGDTKPQHLRRQISNRGIAWSQGKRFYSSGHILYPGFGITQELHNGNRVYALSRMAEGRSISYPSLSADSQYLYFIERRGKERLLKVAALREGKLGPEEVLLRSEYKGILQYTTVFSGWLLFGYTVPFGFQGLCEACTL